MDCPKCGCNGLVDICHRCGAPYINKATAKYLDECKDRKNIINNGFYHKVSKDKKKEMRTVGNNHTLEPWSD